MDLLRYYAETADQVQRLLRVTANGDSLFMAEEKPVFCRLYCFASGSLQSQAWISSTFSILGGSDHAELRMRLG